MQTDVFQTFTEAYAKGDFLQAFQSIIAHPAIHYDEIPSKVSVLPHLINYADSCVFKNLSTVIKTNSTLQLAIESDKQLMASHQDFLSLLKLEYHLLTVPHLTFSPPSVYQKKWMDNQCILDNRDRFVQAKPLLSFLVNDEQKPLHTFAYPSEAFNPTITNPNEKMPLIFLEPIQDLDYAEILSPYRNQPSLFVCQSATVFWHLLQFDSLIPFLCHPLSTIYILELYPSLQLNVQQTPRHPHQQFNPITLTNNTAIQEVIPSFTAALIDSDHDWLYLVAKRLLSRIQTERYGKSRCFALNKWETFQNWFDPHKPRVLHHADGNIGPAPVDYVQQALAEYKKHQQKRFYTPKHKIRLAHVASQLVDTGVAPSQLLYSLAINHHQDLFDIIVISTECFDVFTLDYPPSPRYSPTSTIRGKAMIESLEKQGINVFTITLSTSMEGSALLVNEILHQFNIDVAVFHGPDQINAISSCSCDVPLCVLFEHGTTIAYPGFDIAIVSTEESLTVHQKELAHHHIKGFALPFCVDIRKTWTPHPIPKEQLGFPADAFIMTTISHHLDHRLTDDMCHAIGKILQRSPQAFYAPIGEMKDPKRLLQIFDLYGVGSRFVSLGPLLHPSQYARSMHLYLNEFPFGSCLGMLDAMAAGCPVVSMYDEDGPPQARYAGAYFGKDRVIKNGNIDDYIDLACRLIHDKELYQEWSQYTLSQYEKHANVQQYTREFERIIQLSLKEV